MSKIKIDGSDKCISIDFNLNILTGSLGKTKLMN